MDFEFPRGDTKIFKFQIKDNNGEVLTLSAADKLFFTVKRDPYSSTALFQKTLENGIVLKPDNYYHVTIQPSDTNQLEYGPYGYDIELKTGTGIVKTLIIGSITLTPEYTFAGNEVV